MSKPIEGLMSTTMESIRDMVDVNTVIGDPVVASDGSTVIPVSKVSFGFVSGGGEYADGKGAQSASPSGQTGGQDLPFAGGAGAGVSVSPLAFLVMKEGSVRLLSAQYYAPLDRVIEMVPQLLEDVKSFLTDGKQESTPTA